VQAVSLDFTVSSAEIELAGTSARRARVPAAFVNGFLSLGCASS
jgi:hypothetical protein